MVAQIEIVVFVARLTSQNVCLEILQFLSCKNIGCSNRNRCFSCKVNFSKFYLLEETMCDYVNM